MRSSLRHGNARSLREEWFADTPSLRRGSLLLDDGGRCSSSFLTGRSSNVFYPAVSLFFVFGQTSRPSNNDVTQLVHLLHEVYGGTQGRLGIGGGLG